MTTFFSQPITELIRRRTSWRTFSQEHPLSSGEQKSIAHILHRFSHGPLGTSLRCSLIQAPFDNPKALQRFGTYGLIKNAHSYIVCAITKEDPALLDCGWCFENIILELTALNLATCWLGGIFNRSTLSTEMALKENEEIPVISPVGHPADKRALVDSATCIIAGAKKRKPWSDLFFNGSFNIPLTKDAAGTAAEAFEMVRLGPSASNRQPWRIVQDSKNNMHHFYCYRAPSYSVVLKTFKTSDLQKIDIGIAMTHFEHTLQHLTFPRGTWKNVQPRITAPPHTEYIISRVQ